MLGVPLVGVRVLHVLGWLKVTMQAPVRDLAGKEET